LKEARKNLSLAHFFNLIAESHHTRFDLLYFIGSSVFDASALEWREWKGNGRRSEGLSLNPSEDLPNQENNQY